MELSTEPPIPWAAAGDGVEEREEETVSVLLRRERGLDGGDHFG
jgi:hypothetical protein